VTPLAETHPTVYYRKALFSKEIDFLITEKRITLAEAKLLIMRGFLFHLGLFLKDYSNKVEAKCRNRVRNKDEMFKGEEPHLVSFQIALGELYWENRIKSLNQLTNALILSLHENCEDSSHIVLIQGIEKTMAALTEQQYINKSDKNQLLNQVFESVLGIMQALSENHPSLYIIKGRGDSFSPQGLDLLELTEAISVEKRPFVLSITAPGQETNKAYADAYASPYEEEEEEIKQLMEEKEERFCCFNTTRGRLYPFRVHRKSDQDPNKISSSQSKRIYSSSFHTIHKRQRSVPARSDVQTPSGS